MIAPARRAAFDVLGLVEEGTRTLPDALARLRSRLPEPRDVALATEVAIGTLRWRGTLDYFIAGLASRPLEDIDPAALRALRLSAYQLIHLDRVPASAVVNDGVALAKVQAGPGAAGFVNAVLRRLADPGRRPTLPPRPGGDVPSPDWARYLAIAWSHPHWLVRRWLRRVGLAATEARLRHGQSPAAMTLRAVTRVQPRAVLQARLAAEGVETTPARYAPSALHVRRGNPLHSSAAAEGALMVQDEGSQLVALYAGAAGVRRVLDVCASPGGKAAAMADIAGDDTIIVAGDVRRRRVRLLRDVVRTPHGSRIAIVAHDALAGLPYPDVFDLVLVDAPCSGLGTLRRDPDTKWRRREADVEAFATRQSAMLGHAARVVAPGGRLVYATCSSEPEENEEVARGFLASHSGFRPAAPAAAWEAPPLRELLAASGALEILPERHGLDAFYAVAWERLG